MSAYFVTINENQLTNALWGDMRKRERAINSNDLILFNS